ncbi:hypothetical protein POREN0001_0881 [Porphyromonas endodontalis ATCC 35406]|uniref:Uncharacterized protein n=1 Tax=Porphyromonas endodontalis (strain ATCC 35406 / DSM 24491 / JCM 8526 / CCUG 16442 / BCRC 14492 / NCTC 13058 / HG 370) TaxID=553175 RepID=C3J9V9_POREA|nr:hypothetical protein POREN0001_0881 [Porphyromonas endodontalis ATCC 35406]
MILYLIYFCPNDKDSELLPSDKEVPPPLSSQKLSEGGIREGTKVQRAQKTKGASS